MKDALKFVKIMKLEDRITIFLCNISIKRNLPPEWKYPELVHRFHYALCGQKR